MVKQPRKLNRRQKIQLAAEGKDPKEYAWSDTLRTFIRKDKDAAPPNCDGEGTGTGRQVGTHPNGRVPGKMDRGGAEKGVCKA